MEPLSLDEVSPYGKGLYRWMKSREMEIIKDLAPDGKVTKVLRVLFDSPLRDSIDSDFNGMSFDDLCKFLGVKVN